MGFYRSRQAGLTNVLLLGSPVCGMTFDEALLAPFGKKTVAGPHGKGMKTVVAATRD